MRLPAGSFCKVEAAAATITGFTPLAGNSCSPDFSFVQTGQRVLWNPVRNLDVGLDVVYTKLNSAYKGPANWVANGSRPACVNATSPGGCAHDDEGVWSAMFRWQRNFYP